MDNIRAVLSPLLFVSYVCGTRIIEFPAGKPRLWCSFSYILLLWSIYHFLLWSKVLHLISKKSLIMQFGFWLINSVALLSVVLGIYHDKKYRTCLRKIAIVDDTLEKIGTTKNHQKLYTKVLFTVFGWFAYLICTTYGSILWHRDRMSTIYSFYISFMFQYPICITFLDDLFMINTLRYVEQKFEQLNEYFRNLNGDNEHGIKGHSVLLPCQARFPKSISNEYATWIAMYSQESHLHLELCRISRVLNSIFGIQMTLKMGAYFVFVAVGFRELFNVLLIANYEKRKTLFIIMYTIFLVSNIFRLFIINYICEKVSVKANTTGNMINRISYSTFDAVVRENISQFLLQINLIPLKFHGLRLFTFGLKFFHGFSSSVSTVIVILVQSHMET